MTYQFSYKLHDCLNLYDICTFIWMNMIFLHLCICMYVRTYAGILHRKYYQFHWMTQWAIAYDTWHPFIHNWTESLFPSVCFPSWAFGIRSNATGCDMIWHDTISCREPSFPTAMQNCVYVYPLLLEKYPMRCFFCYKKFPLLSSSVCCKKGKLFALRLKFSVNSVLKYIS